MLSVNGVVVLDIATFLLTEAIALLPVIFLSMLRAARWHRIMIRREDARSVGNGVMATFGTLFLVLIGIWLFDGNSEPSKIIAKETATLTEITTEAMPGEIETRNEGYAVGMEN